MCMRALTVDKVILISVIITDDLEVQYNDPSWLI